MLSMLSYFGLLCDQFIQEDVVDVSSRTFEEPYVELFLWAVICNKGDTLYL